MRPSSYKIQVFNLIEKFQRRWFAKNDEEFALLNGFFVALSEKLTVNEMSLIDDGKIRSLVDLLLQKNITIEEIRKMTYDELTNLLIVDKEDKK